MEKLIYSVLMIGNVVLAIIAIIDGNFAAAMLNGGVAFMLWSINNGK